MSRMKIAVRAGLGTTLILAACWLQTATAKPKPAPAGGRPQAGSRPGSGSISGKILFKGARPKLAQIDMSKDPVCAANTREPGYVEDGKVNPNGTLPNAFVFVKAGLKKLHFQPPSKPVTLDQRWCTYYPHVLGVMAGQPLRILNSDPTTHNTHFLPKINSDWNRSQPPGGAPLVHKFTQPEIMIPVECNLHPWMKAYVGVTSNPFYKVTKSSGTYSLKGLPPGDYTVEAWTATFGAEEKKVTVKPEQATTLDFTFTAH
jgi:plastocyanin